MNTKRSASLFVVLAACMWGSLGITVKVLAGYGFTPIQMVVAKLWVSVILLGAYMAITDFSKLKIKKKDIKWFIGTGTFCILFYNICYCVAIQLTSLSVAAVLLYTSPIFVTLLSVPIFKEKITLKKVLAIMFSVLGCTLVSGVLSSTTVKISINGIFVGICAAIGYALYGILAKILVTKYHSLTILFYSFLFAGIGGLFVGDVKGIVGIVTNEPMSIVAVLITALMCNIVPYILFTTALKYIKASKVSIIASIEPVVATVIGFIAFGEAMSFVKILGIICVLVAIRILSKES